MSPFARRNLITCCPSLANRLRAEPDVGVVEGVPVAMLASGNSPGPMIIVSSLVCFALLLGGAYYFRRVERTFADIL